MEAILKSYIYETNEVEKAGLEVELKNMQNTQFLKVFPENGIFRIKKIALFFEKGHFVE